MARAQNPTAHHSAYLRKKALEAARGATLAEIPRFFTDLSGALLGARSESDVVAQKLSMAKKLQLRRVLLFMGNKGEFELDQLARASQILPGRVLQGTNMSNSVKQPFYLHLLPLTLPQHPQPPPPPQLTIGDCHELPLLAVGPPHGEE
ncbi:hypothetical protein D0Y65_043247 [Glycine soja]|uniref:Uncharacterized protein n=1 Tax=Glycine soja TaxID=3848 RepID=A0A445GGP1_GLYSO|nr:hypothetical protein D0Y65_043247 [Glycine soja]